MMDLKSVRPFVRRLSVLCVLDRKSSNMYNLAILVII